MSASPSPAGGPNGQRPTPPPGAPPLRRPRNTANPLVPRKKQPVRRPPPPGLGRGAAPSAAPRPASRPQQPALGGQGPLNFDTLRSQNGGWSTPTPPGAQDYPLYVTKKSLKEGLRFHVMRFAPHGGKFHQHGNPGIDPTNQDEFTRPVTLHRRDPKQPPPGREVKEEEVPVEEDPAATAEAEKIALLKAEREAQRAADNAQKAPVAKDALPKAKQQHKEPKKPGLQIHYAPRTEEQKKQNEIRYEEALPWHLEDADGKNVWVGQYEAPLSDCKVAFKIHNNGFRMIPLEKWYRFTSKRGSFKSMSIEEAEKAMNKKVAPGRWIVRDTQRQEAEKAMAESRILVNGRPAIKQESGTFMKASRGEKMDHDDIDMSGDEFQDDDETAGYEPDRDEDSKTANERIRRDQLGANLFGDADEAKVEKEAAVEEKEKLERKRLGKGLKKSLRKVDKQFQYESDSESNRDPFASSEDESDSDLDNEKEDEEKKADKDKDAGTPSKGSSTPQGKKAAAEAAKKGKSLKRAGSPMVSDSSGTESTRKKKKTTHGNDSRSGTPLPRRSKVGAGSTSDGEGTAGEMSDGAGGKKRSGLLAVGGKDSKRPTPTGSRATSPAPPQGNPNKGPTAGPRAGSPDSGKLEPITPQEILDALPPLGTGVTIGVLIRPFKNRLDKPGHMTRKEWLRIVKANARYNQAEKLIIRDK
ncbi:Rap30/74 interaction domain-containing protein [Hypoxylon trugodes]|uniref:Rap30/74 interaction domain-containing protein n=1 Tax=Hypoxylon trugodes TaxID=326681 RepID=UPI0021A23C3C|nr:Rap30/74 interaction domain-containing protein [Hypoxylon trugodes]KAI1383384.1 Rap30/74 interaction domain-containing protein [Hypoxylon trugodes]